MWDSSGSLFALGVRLTRIDATGAPIPGATNCYKSNALIQIGVGLEYRDGAEVEQVNGSGNICLYYAAPPTVKRGTIGDFQVCSPDPNILSFVQGGDIIAGDVAVAEVQTITISGTPTGGTYKLTFDGKTTANIAFNANAAAIQAALEALSNIDPGDVTVAGTGPYTATFTTAEGNVPQMTANDSGLTGGTSPAVTVTTTTPGHNLTDIGYAAPAVGTNPTPNGIGLEWWTAAIQDGAYASELPYLHWLAPLARLTQADDLAASGENALTPAFEGFTYQNKNWGAGPDGNWVVISDRVWQYVREATLPDLTPGYVTIS